MAEMTSNSHETEKEVEDKDSPSDSSDSEDDHRLLMIHTTANLCDDFNDSSRPSLQSHYSRLIAFKNNKTRKMASNKPYHMPEDFVNLSFLACCLFCPIGILALLNSYKVQYYFDIGDIEKSQNTSERTRRLAKRAIFIGCIIAASIFVFLLTLAFIFTILFKPNAYY